jgi:hypothetical protein
MAEAGYVVALVFGESGRFSDFQPRFVPDFGLDFDKVEYLPGHLPIPKPVRNV